MAGRFNDWHHLKVRGDKALARRYLSEGRKWLGFLLEQQALGGQQQVIEKRNASGVHFRAELSGTQPILTIDVTSLLKPEPVVDIAGFVTWPTDTDGETAIPESVRIILAGSEYRPVREPGYSPLFPGGLNEAGNVDWKGKGWAVSWYGPRARYFETEPPLMPKVYMKGLPVVDVTDYVSPYALILGACVTMRFGGPWLVVVSEDWFSSRWEDVWCIRLRNPDTGEVSKATDAKFEVIPDSFVLMDSRASGSDFLSMRHPWFFNPDGLEARMLCEGTLGLTERIINLVEDEDSDSGFSVERDAILHGYEEQTVFEGFNSAEWGAYFGKFTGTRRPSDWGMSDVSMPTGTAPPGVGTVSVGGTLPTADFEGSYILSNHGLLNYSYSRNIGSVVLWQPIAVDYKADGTVVYAYGRTRSLVETKTGGYTAECPEINCTWTDSTWSGSYGAAYPDGVENPGYYNGHLLTVDYGLTVNGGDALIEVTNTTSTVSVENGIRMGDIEFTVGDSVALTTGGTAALHISAFSDNAPATYDPNAGVFLNHLDNEFGGAAFIPSVHTSEIATTSDSVTVDQSLYLAHMDLRHDALFYVVHTATVTQGEDVTLEWTELEPPTGTWDTVITRNYLDTWQTRGYIHGELVLDETVTSRDEDDNFSSSFDVPDQFSLESYDNIGVNHEALIDDPLNFSNVFSFIPRLNTWLPIWYNTLHPEDPDIQPPVPFAETETSPVKDEYMYGPVTSSYPIAMQLILSWHIEVAATPPEVEGFSTGDVDDNGRVKVKWHYDVEGIGSVGSWAYYKDEWAYSMSLPAPVTGSGFRMSSKYKKGDIYDRALTSEEQDSAVVEHFYPIWVLPPTKGFRP